MTTTTVCLIAKNEAPYMVEWLAHYITLGFDRIVVYDNDSSDATAEMVRACADIFPGVHLRNWPAVSGEVPQTAAYADAVKQADTDWIGFFDADELLVLKQHDSIARFLDRYPDEAGGVAINWLLFGSSGEAEYREELQAERFRMRARSDSGTKNRFIKSLARVSAISEPLVHCVLLHEGFSYFDDAVQRVELLNSAKTAVPSHEFAQLNHYIVRSRGEFAEKQRRGNAARADNAPDKFAYRNEDFWRAHNTNHLEDSAIDPWIQRSQQSRELISARLGVLGIDPLPCKALHAPA